MTAGAFFVHAINNLIIMPLSQIKKTTTTMPVIIRPKKVLHAPYQTLSEWDKEATRGNIITKT